MFNARGNQKGKVRRSVALVLAGAACLCMLGSGCSAQQEPAPAEITEEPTVAAPTPEPTLAEAVATPEPTPEPSVAAKVMLPKMAELYNQNPDTVGWIQIDDTRVDYPVMYTPTDGQFYLYRTFEKEEDPTQEGCVFVDEHCTVDPRSTNLLIHGHNMKNGTMFASLMNYESEDFYKEHPIINYTTLYEEQQYEIAYVFQSRVYNVDDDVWKFYKFYNAANEQEYNDYTSHCKELELYDTGVTCQYDDDLLTLTTCNHHEEYGRLVVVARRITDEFPAQGEFAKEIMEKQQQTVEGELTPGDGSGSSDDGSNGDDSGSGSEDSGSGEDDSGSGEDDTGSDEE